MAIIKAGAEPLADLAAFLEPFAKLLRRVENKRAFERYATGLLAGVPRKTTAGMGRALRGTNPARAGHEFLGRTHWDAREMDRLRMAHMLKHASVGDGVLVIGDTGLPKKGKHSVGVARQYSGTLGRVDNRQVVVTCHHVDAVFDWPVMARVYLPEGWAEDHAAGVTRKSKGARGDRVCHQRRDRLDVDRRGAGRGRKAARSGVRRGLRRPAGVAGRSGDTRKALRSSDQLRAALPAGRSDPGRSGRSTSAPSTRERTPRQEDRVGNAGAGPGSPGNPGRSAPGGQGIAWREGAKGALVKEFARVRVHRTGEHGNQLESVGWVIGERPLPGHGGDPKYYFAWGLDELLLEQLVKLSHVRWVIERFYQDAQGELGLDDYEGRSWHGLHRPIAMVMLAHSFLTLRQSYGPNVLNQSRRAPARGFPPGGPAKPGRASARGARRVVPASHHALRQRS